MKFGWLAVMLLAVIAGTIVLLFAVLPSDVSIPNAMMAWWGYLVAGLARIMQVFRGATLAH
jgi:hypothetical protein